MTVADFARTRLHNQQLITSRLRTPADVVAWLGAVQAQEFAMARWALGARLTGVRDAEVERAFNAGELLRTHVLRPTWHFVTPGDIRWMSELSAPRIRQMLATWDRKLGIDAALLKRSRAVFIRALRGGEFLTRSDLQAALARARIEAEGQRLGHLVMYAEIDALLCSGSRIGKQFTYALVDQRAPQARSLKRAEALHTLASRYFASRGPATVHDFASWSGLTVKEARLGSESLGSDFGRESIEGAEYIFPVVPHVSLASSAKTLLPTHLLPDYDEYGIGYKDRSALGDPAAPLPEWYGDNRAYNRNIVVDGRVVGTWRRSEGDGEIEVEAVLFGPLSVAKRKSLAAAAQRFGAFLERPVRLEIHEADKRAFK